MEASHPYTRKELVQLMAGDFQHAALVGVPVDALCYIAKKRSNLELVKFGTHMKESVAKTATSIVVANMTEYVGFKVLKNPTFGERLGVTMLGKFTSSIASDMIYRKPKRTIQDILKHATLIAICEGLIYVVTKNGSVEWLSSKGYDKLANHVQATQDILSQVDKIASPN